MDISNHKWFGVVRWCDDDIKNALIDNGYSDTEENISIIRKKCEHHCFQDAMIETGWNYIHAYISEEEDHLSVMESRTNEHLKKDDLPRMVDQPVWFVPLGEVASDCKEGWAIWDGEYIFSHSISRNYIMYMFRYEDYGERWIAYSKPLTETR